MTTTHTDAGTAYTATELRMQLSTLEGMVGAAYRHWHQLSMQCMDDDLEIDEAAHFQLRTAAMADYERLRGWYRTTLEAYHAASTDNSLEIRQGW